ncbi:aldo/keto reductase [Georgenia sp. TF02-10]|uniref:aldo/keto reductase n=1 Tax=Georgenia sp. TF02-10 TaxID=2917725 RepID=UPI001FA76CF7|nr:aldo/keto reductase [Georgenia sp. TF02-10]UNX54294.1 aldo/keto reductase [Georgenia sp. TF02-10]
MTATERPHAAAARLGRSPVAVSRLSLGTAPLAGLYQSVSEAEAIGTVERALELGVTYLDTAPLYGAGNAERRLGRALRGVPRDRYVVSTKVGRLLRPVEDAGASMFANGDRRRADVFDFSASAVRQGLEESLSRLGLDSVDVVYIHDPDDAVDQAIHETYPALAELRTAGVIGAIGVGMNEPGVPARFIQETDVDVVLVAGRYSLLERDAAVELLPAAVERGVSVVAAGVLNSGILADPRPGARFNYLPAAADRIARAQRLQDVCAQFGVPLTAAALQFPARHPAISSVLVGCRSGHEVADDVELFDTPIGPACWAALEAACLAPAEAQEGIASW